MVWAKMTTVLRFGSAKHSVGEYPGEVIADRLNIAQDFLAIHKE